MSLFRKKKKKEKYCPGKNLDVAKQISLRYAELEECCSLLSNLSSIKDPNDIFGNYHLGTGGWKIFASTIARAGIDINDIYNYIKKLTENRKSFLEDELKLLQFGNEKITEQPNHKLKPGD